MPSLLDVQRGFRTAVLAGAGLPSAITLIGGRVGAEARIGIYRNNVIGNLTRALRLSYPAVERLVGEDFFAAVAQRFIAAAPPRAADLNRYGEGFAAFLAEFEQAKTLSYLPDVARLEWAVGRALHAPPSSMLAPDALTVVPPELEADLCFEAHPTLSLLSLEYPARAIWEAALTDNSDERGARLATIDLDSGGDLLAVLRDDGTLTIEALSPPAFEFARALTDGCALGEALALVPADQAASLLAGFMRHGFFADFSLPSDIRSTLIG